VDGGLHAVRPSCSNTCDAEVANTHATNTPNAQKNENNKERKTKKERVSLEGDCSEHNGKQYAVPK